MKYKTMIGVLACMTFLLTACDASSGTAQTKATAAATQAHQTTEIVMYKSPNCECCDGWAEHLRKAGFTVKVNKRDDMDAMKAANGVPKKLASCHTAIIDGYVIEGHVPAKDVKRLLKERPDIVGLTAPGMPMKSPGMQDVGQTPRNYDVLSFSKDGTSKVFTHY